MAISLSDILGIIIVAALGAYFIVGLVVVLFLIFRGPKMSLPPRNGMLWEEKDNERNVWWWLSVSGRTHPVGIVLHLLIWPLWFMSYLDSLDAEDEETPPQYLGPTDDNPPRGRDDL
jgi:hypothetical protein